jgi:hypothetical protein
MHVDADAFNVIDNVIPLRILKHGCQFGLSSSTGVKRILGYPLNCSSIHGEFANPSPPR